MHQQFLAIFLLNLLTSLDNAIIIAGISNRYKNLLAIAITSSVVITVCRTVLIMGVVSVSKWPGLRFTLGIAVLIVAMSLVHVKSEDERNRASFWRVLLIVVTTDLALSVDNILSISIISQNPFIIAASVFVSLLPLFLLLPVIVRVMSQAAWLRILAAGFVAELAVDSITDDPWIVHRMPTGHFEITLRVASAAIVILYGFWRAYGQRQRST